MQHHRRIRSFVRREGRLTAAQARSLEENRDRYGLELTDGVLDIDSAFGRKAETTMEIGFGNGETLFQLAAEHPGINYLGVEVYRSGTGRLLNLAAGHDLHNLKVYCEDAVPVLKNCIPPESLDKVLLYFPDPWPKKRHHKRRLVNQDFASLVARVLRPAATWQLATDWQNYAEQMLEVLNAHPAFRNLSETGDYVERPDDRPLTRFERRGLGKGHVVRDLAFEKI